jgi:hypothetical protein
MATPDDTTCFFNFLPLEREGKKEGGIPFGDH